MRLDNNQQAFFALVKAGLWEQNARLLQFEKISFQEVYRLAEEQSVVGLVAAGLEQYDVRCKKEHVNCDIPKDILLTFVGRALQLEQRNIAMNHFVARLTEKLRKEDIYAILVKGQGIAQCYQRPLWRASGDIDLLLDTENYEKAKKFLQPFATDVETEYTHFKHQALTINGWEVELHGTLHSRLSKRVDRVIDEAQKDVLSGGKVRYVEFNSSSGSKVQVFLPAPDEDIIFVFSHILHHFYIEGIGLRQICDWCRLLWTYRDSLNHKLLESRIRKAGLMSEWKAFGALAIEYLGFPKDSMPLLNANVELNRNLKKKAERIMGFVLESGNFGHNRKVADGKFSSAWNKMTDFIRHSRIFPLDSVNFLFHFVGDGIKVATS